MTSTLFKFACAVAVVGLLSGCIMYVAPDHHVVHPAPTSAAASTAGKT